MLKEDREALVLFVAKDPNKKKKLLVTLKQPILQFFLQHKEHYASFVEVPPEQDPVVIFYAFAVVCSAPTQPTQEILNNSIIKLYKLRESKETILMFDSYKDELE